VKSRTPCRRLSRITSIQGDLICPPRESLNVEISDPTDSRDATRRESSEEESGRWVLKLSRGAPRKRVENRKHFNHLMTKYLVAHRGVKWFEDRGWVE
jgi:hypothetical protein